METQKRGQLTERIVERAKQLMGREIDVTELRLMAYMQYVMLNDQHIDILRVNKVEKDILTKWRTAGYLEDGATKGTTISKEFWDIMSEILWLGYVDRF